MNKKQLDILLWVLQILLALYNTAGAIYMVGHYQILSTGWAVNTFPKPLWMLFGLLQVLFSIGLVLPRMKGNLRNATAISAAGLAIISLLGVGLYVMYSGTGMLWGIIPAVLAAFIAYKRGVTSK